MKKTYSKLNEELSGLGDGVNIKTDPFDELLSSPLKQNIEFQPLSFWGRKKKEPNSKNKPRKVKCGLFESSESDEDTLYCESSGFDDKENLCADSFEETLSYSLNQHNQLQTLTFQDWKEKESGSKNRFNKDKHESIESSDYLSFIPPLKENSFLSGLQNVTKRRGAWNDSHKKNNEESNGSSEETIEKVNVDPQLRTGNIVEPSQIFNKISLQNITKRRGSSNESFNKNSEKFNESFWESTEVELDTQVDVNPTLEPSRICEKISLRNVTRRRGLFNDLNYSEPSIIFQKNEDIKSVTKFEIDQTFELSQMTERLSLDSNKTIFFAHPILESTRVHDVSPLFKKVPHKDVNQSPSILEKTKFNFGYTLKPGKDWLRSMSVLKQIQNGSMVESGLESTRITGKKFGSFVQDLLEMQSGPLCEYRTDNYLNISDISLRSSDNCSVLSRTVPDKSMFERSLLNYTVKVVQSKDRPSAFKTALGLETYSLVQDDSVRNKSSAISAKDFILIQCGQRDVLPFEEFFNERTLKNCKKIGEGVYGEVFKTDEAVIKIIPIEGSDKVNGEPQKTFEEIVSEVVIASKLSSLRKGEKRRTCGFSEMRRCWCVQGKYPKYLLELWNEYDQTGNGSENDSPVMFKNDQLYIILELANGGKDLESFVFNSSAQSLSIFIQVAFSLAVAEKAFEFEHRDLHWGNVLISPTKDEFMTVLLNGFEYKIPTKGVKVCIIDFTLSRISHEGCCIFNDLSVDPGLFASEGDYQFEIYRMMLREVENDWSHFRPRTNIYWLHYMLDKMLKMVRYKNRKAKLHTKHLKSLQTLESIVLEHSDCENFVLSDTLHNIRKNL